MERGSKKGWLWSPGGILQGRPAPWNLTRPTEWNDVEKQVPHPAGSRNKTCSVRFWEGRRAIRSEWARCESLWFQITSEEQIQSIKSPEIGNIGKFKLLDGAMKKNPARRHKNSGYLIILVSVPPKSPEKYYLYFFFMEKKIATVWKGENRVLQTKGGPWGSRDEKWQFQEPGSVDFRGQPRGSEVPPDPPYTPLGFSLEWKLSLPLGF